MSPARRILITGAAGFVGGHLVAHLREAHPDWRIIGTARTARAEDTPILPCDLRDGGAARDLVRSVRPDVVIHLAAQSNVPASLADPEATLANNIFGTLHLLDACRMYANEARILLVSSSEVYGPTTPAEQPLREDRPLHPVNPYAVSKATQEMLALQYAYPDTLDVVVARPFNHIGPGQRGDFVVARLARQIAAAERGGSQTITMGNLETERDFTDVRDIARAYDLLLRHGERKTVYNIGRGEAVSIRRVLDLLRSMAAVPVRVEQDPARLRASDVPIMVADTGRLRDVTGWMPQIPLEQTLRETLDWWRSTLAQEKAYA